MKLTSLSEATSKFGRVDFWYSDEDLKTSKDIEFHVDDVFKAGPTINQIYRFGDGTKFYFWTQNLRSDVIDPAIANLMLEPDMQDFYSGQVVIDKNSKRYDYKSSRDFHKDWGHYIDSITGAYDTKSFGPKEVAEFRQVFNL